MWLVSTWARPFILGWLIPEGTFTKQRCVGFNQYHFSMTVKFISLNLKGNKSFHRLNRRIYKLCCSVFQFSCILVYHITPSPRGFVCYVAVSIIHILIFFSGRDKMSRNCHLWLVIKVPCMNCIFIMSGRIMLQTADGHLKISTVMN